MTLLESITRAAAAAAAQSIDGSGGKPSPLSKYPIVLNPNEILPNLKHESGAPNGASPAVRVTGWKISETDAEITELATHLTVDLKRRLRNPSSLDKAEFLGLLNSFLRKNAEKIRFSLSSNPAESSEAEFVRVGIEKLGFLIGREVAGLISECCAVLELWEILKTLIVRGLIGHPNSINLVEKLVEKNQSELLCLFVKHVPDLSSAQLVSVLNYFLSPNEDSYKSMIAVRKEWERQALSAIEKATQMGLPKKVSKMAREASILLMMAHDGFSSSELCLHYVFGSENFDGLVLSSAISRLDGSEVLGLIRYFLKWLEKYQKFPQARPCPSAGSLLELKACESIPSLESALRGFGLVLDEHFSYLVLNSKFHFEMRAAEKIVTYLALEADLCCPVNDIIKHLKSALKQKSGN